MTFPLNSINWGDLRNQEPLDRWWGYGRGTPIDRFYIESFLEKHQECIKGHCIEIMDDSYVRKFGRKKVERTDILDIDQKNEKATIIGDLTNPSSLTTKTFDCLILTQTLSAIFDAGAALKTSYYSLRQGGCLLITAPALCRYSPYPEDHWRFTRESMSNMIIRETDCEDWNVSVHGNLIASIASLTGMAVEELSTEELEHHDDHYPIVVTAKLIKK